jgi:hypothetical protein
MGLELLLFDTPVDFGAVIGDDSVLDFADRRRVGIPLRPTCLSGLMSVSIRGLGRRRCGEIGLTGGTIGSGAIR